MFHMCIAERTIAGIQQDASCGSVVFSSPEKWYKVSRQHVLGDIFDHEAVRRKIYQLYKEKQHVTTKKLLVYDKTLCYGCQTMKYCAIYNTGCFMEAFTVCWEENITIKTT